MSPIGPTAGCVTDEQLSDYVRGVLSDEASEAITDHLEICGDCMSRLDGIDLALDGLVSQLRREARMDLRPSSKTNEFDTGTMTDTGGETRSGNALGFMRDYRLLRELGHGGMGIVYQAVHTRLDQVVAVKVLSEHRALRADLLARFDREMKAIGKLNHPNIVRAQDAGEADGNHFLVMEFVDGLDLSAIAKRLGPLPIAEACEVIRHVAIGLQHAHDHGLVHRDIKPSNVMITQTGVSSCSILGLHG